MNSNEENYASWLDAEKKQAMLAAIIDSSEDAIISKTLTGRITSWNKAAEKLFGYTEQEVIGKHISILLPEERLKEEDLIISRIMAGDTVDHFPTVRKTKDGKEIDISLTISPIRDRQNNIIGASKIARDISKQKETEQALKDTNLELQKLNIYKDQFIGLASHELKTPLTTIQAYFSLIERYPERSGEFTVKGQRQLTRLTNLINDLLDVSKIQTGKLAIQRAPCSLLGMIHNTIEAVQSSSRSHTIVPELPDVDTIINIDELRIEQVLINLLTNAIKYSPRADTVIIRAHTTPADVIISVHDKGHGLTKTDIGKIFTRFYRVNNPDSVASGLGIGLHISQHIVAQHGGKIWVESEPGKGSVFYFSIPVEVG